MSETRLFPSENCTGYFGSKRFDRMKDPAGMKEKRVHMSTTAALLELDFEQPCLDYHDLMKLTKILTGEDRNGVNPDKKELIAVGLKAGLKKSWCEACADDIKACVNHYLRKYI